MWHCSHLAMINVGMGYAETTFRGEFHCTHLCGGKDHCYAWHWMWSFSDFPILEIEIVLPIVFQ